MRSNVLFSIQETEGQVDIEIDVGDTNDNIAVETLVIKSDIFPVFYCH